MRVPAILSEEQLVLRLLDDAAVLVHPGYFFDFDEEAYLVLSLLPAVGGLRRGICALWRALAREIES